MKKLALSLAAIASIAATAPSIANAQMKYPWTGSYGTSLDQRERNIEVRIQRGMARGEITFGEARSLRVQLRNIERLEARYSWGGFTRAEVIDLNTRLSRLENRVMVAANDYDGGRRYGYGYGYGR